MAYCSHALSVNRHADFTILEVELELEVVCKECLTKDLVGVNLHVTENVWFILCGPLLMVHSKNINHPSREGLDVAWNGA